MKRRLSAILAADVVGYSRLMGDDEGGILERLKSLRLELVQPAITKRSGRIVKLMGDGLLAEFPSVVEAVQCAIDIQRSMIGREAYLPDERRLRLRIGVNLGDIIVEGSDIYGDGVNVAARLEGLAEPGGICISGPAFDTINGKLDASFEDAGEQQLKNIAKPVRIYRLGTGSPQAGSPAHRKEPLPLPDKPSIAILPFDNMSGDQEQEYFADGMTEDIITALSKGRAFFVIARNSTFAFKGTAINITEVAEKLGVRYVLEGSVRKGGNRVRINAQLIEAATGRHVWAERYDRELEDIFDLQDEITQTIVAALEPELAAAERERAIRKAPESLDVWDIYQRGMWHHHKFNKEDNAQAGKLFRAAIKIDPKFALARSALAHAGYWDVLFGFVDDEDAVLDEALAQARSGLALDDREPYAHFAMGRVQMLMGELEESVLHLRKSIELNPNFAHAQYGLALALILSGRAEEGIGHCELALRLNPFDPAKWTFEAGKGIGLLALGRFDETVECTVRSSEQGDAGFWTFAVLAAAHFHLGNQAEAEKNMLRALEINGRLDAAFIERRLHFANPKQMDLWMNGLLKSGMPK